MGWAIVHKGFDTPLLVLDVQFTELVIPEEYQTEEYQLVPLTT